VSCCCTPAGCAPAWEDPRPGPRPPARAGDCYRPDHRDRCHVRLSVGIMRHPLTSGANRLPPFVEIGRLSLQFPWTGRGWVGGHPSGLAGVPSLRFRDRHAACLPLTAIAAWRSTPVVQRVPRRLRRGRSRTSNAFSRRWFPTRPVRGRSSAPVAGGLLANGDTAARSGVGCPPVARQG
jgi:hypothetical protein